MGELLLLLGASIYVLALLVYIFMVFSTQKSLALIMLFFPPLVFVNVIVSRLKFAALVLYQLLGLILLGSGVAIEYPQKVAEYSGLNIGIFHSDDLNQNRVVRINRTEGKSSLAVEKRDLPRDQARQKSVISPAVEKEKSASESQPLIPEPLAPVTASSLGEASHDEVVSLAEEILESTPTLSPTEEPAPTESISFVGSSDDEVSFWQDEEEDESMSMGDPLEAPAQDISGDSAEGVDLKQTTQSPPKPQEGLPVDTVNQVEDSVIVLEPRLNDEPAQNIIEAKEQELPAHILEERERVRKKQLEMDLLAESLQAKVGKIILVEKHNAQKEEGKLLSVNNKKLALEKRIGGGTMESFIKLADIKEVRSTP